MIGLSAVLGLAMLLQVPQGSRASTTVAPAGSSIRVALPTDSSAVAVRATVAPIIDGKDDDQIWRDAPPITAFTQWQPTEGKAPRFRTEAKIAYDAANLFIFVRAFDPHPDSIIRILERRDTFTPSDMIWIFVDSFHDRRTGYEFGVNAAGVKIDQAIYDDGNEDGAWDAVWDVATRIDSLGWTAEFRIPLSQMRYSGDRAHTFGFTIDRDIYRYSERVSWPLLRQSKPGFVSQFGELGGLDDLQAPRRLEAMPYSSQRMRHRSRTTRSPTSPTSRSAATSSTASRRTSRSTPRSIRTSARWNRIRPCSTFGVRVVLRRAAAVFRRRARAVPLRRQLQQRQLQQRGALLQSAHRPHSASWPATYGDTVPEQPTTILGAAKLLGRFPSGLVVRRARRGHAARDERGRHDVRAGDELRRRPGDGRILRNGNSSVGGMLTAVNRNARPVVVAVSWRRARMSARSIFAIAFSRTRTRYPDRSIRAACREAAPRSSESADGRRPLLSAPGRRTAARFQPHVARRRRRGIQVR